MKTSTPTQVFVAGVAAATFASGAFAIGQQDINRFGTPAPEKAASRVIKLDTASKYLNVTRGETATIVKDGKAFTWHFYTLNNSSFELAAIAPKDFGASQIRVYVAPSPQDSGR